MTKVFLGLFFLLLTDLLAIEVSCPARAGFETTLKFNKNNSFTCQYNDHLNNKYEVVIQNISKKSELSAALSEVIRSNRQIAALPADQQRLAAMKFILKAIGKDEGMAEGQLALLDDDSASEEIDEALNAITGGVDGYTVAGVSIEAQKETEKQLAELEKDIHSGNMEFSGVTPKIDSHTEYEKTFPAILSGVLTLDPEYFRNDGKIQYINNLGEVVVNSDFIRTYVFDKSGNSEGAFSKFTAVIKDALFSSNSGNLDTGSFDVMNFVDKQVIGFYVYLLANLSSFYNSLSTLVFLIGVAAFSLYTFAKYSISTQESTSYNILSKWMNNGASDQGGWASRATKNVNLSPAIGTFMSFVGVIAFFLAPTFKDDVATNGSIERAIYKNGNENSSEFYGYSTAAQVLIRYNVQLGNYFGNLMNDYAMHSYVFLLQNKMGAIEDVLPRFITETKAQLSEVARDKESLASKAELFNKACRPYYKNGVFNVPANTKPATTGGEKIAIVGDAIGSGVAKSLAATNSNVISYASAGTTAENLASKVAPATAANVSTIVLSVGWETIKAGSYAGIPLAEEGWKEKYVADLQNAYIAANQNGRKVYCLSPYSDLKNGSSTMALAIGQLHQKVCPSYVQMKTLQPTKIDTTGLPTPDGYKILSGDLEAKVVATRADFVDAKSCKNLMDQIVSESNELSVKSASVNTKANDARGFVDNITSKQSPNSGKSFGSPTTDPTKVKVSNKNIAKRSDVWNLHNGSFGYFTLPMSAEKPGWSTVGRISKYGIKDASGTYEKGTGEKTATGEGLSSFTGLNAFVAANWHLPLNTIVEVTMPYGDKFYFRTADRGPVVKYKQKYAPGQKVTAGTADKAPPNRPHHTSDRFIDLPPIAYNKLCAKTDQWVTVKVVSYNASRLNPPKQPMMTPNGGITIDPKKCKTQVALEGGLADLDGGGDEAYGEEPYMLFVDNSPVRVLNDYIALVGDLSNAFGWVSAITVPTSYEFYKYVNLFFVNNAEISSNPDDDLFKKEAMAELDRNGAGDEVKDNIGDKIVDTVIGDVLVKNAVWFAVPGFSNIQEAIYNRLDKFIFIRGTGEDGLERKHVNNSLGIMKRIVAGAVGMMLGGTMGSGGGALDEVVNTTLGAAAGIMLFSESHVAVVMSMAIISMVLAIAVVTVVISTISIMLISVVLTIQAVAYFVEISIFFIFSPAIGIVAAFRGQTLKYLVSFMQRLIAIMTLPILIIVPAYLFIPVSELFRGLMSALSDSIFMVMNIGEKFLGASSSNYGITDKAKGVIIKASVAGMFEIFTMIASAFVVIIFFMKFKNWIQTISGFKQGFSVTESEVASGAKDSISKYIAPV